MIWWIWTALPVEVHTYNVNLAWSCPEPDVYWLGECAWTARTDNAGTGLR